MANILLEELILGNDEINIQNTMKSDSDSILILL